jgi:hypothetical protein
MRDGMIVAGTLSLRAVVFIYAAVLHLFTVYMSFKAFGLLGAAITFIGAFLAQFFWIYTLFKESGVFFNNFTIACLVWVVLAVARAIVTAKAEEAL